MSEIQATISLPKSRFIIMWVTIGILAIALLLTWFTLSKQEKIPRSPPTPGGLVRDQESLEVLPGSELDRFLERGGYGTMMFLNPQAQLKVLGRDGKSVAPCGTIRGTEVPEPCDLDKVSVTNVNTVTILAYEKNPTCIWVKSNGTMVKVHQQTGHGPPCHDPLH